MASTEVLGGETPAGHEDEQEREVLESEAISSGGSPDELLDAMTHTLATQVLDDFQGSGPGGENEETIASPGQSASKDSSDAEPPKAASLPGPVTQLEVYNSGDPDDRSGEIIHDRYLLVRQLGKGGMGTVYIARHTALPKTFAVKVLNARYAKRRDVAGRFLQEAQAVSLIEHENVVGVIDHGEEADGTAFLVMEHLRGESLKTVTKREAPMAWERVEHIMGQMCRALQAAHDVGIIHRDIKPENVIRVGRHGDPDFIKILDFGLAKMQVSGGLRLTQTGMVLGTPDYMSPEQARGLPTDHRADVYASGIMMYELLCGSVPFKAKTFQAIRQLHMLEPPEPPSRRMPDANINAAMDAIVLKALAKEPHQRFASMAEMAEAIAAVGTGTAPVDFSHPTPTIPLLAERGVLERARTDGARALAEAAVLPPHPSTGRPRTGPGTTKPLLPHAKLELDATEPLMARPELPAKPAEPKPAPTGDKRGVVIGVVLGLAAALAAGIWAFTLGPLAPEGETPADEPAAVEPAPQPPSTHAVLRFEGNIPVIVRDIDGVARFGNEARTELMLPRSDDPLQLVLHAEGYRDLHVVVTPDSDQILEYELLPLPAPEPGHDAASDAPSEPEPEPEPAEAAPKPSKPKPSKPKPVAEPAPADPPEEEPADEPEPANDDHSFSPEIVDPFEGKKG